MLSRVYPEQRPLAAGPKDSGLREHGLMAALRESLSLDGDSGRRAGRPTAPRGSLFSDSGGPPARVAVARRRRGGMTLLELLVALAVVAMLIALLLPALGRVRHQAREAQGASQTRQIALATLQHMSDHNRRLPQVRLDPHGNISEDPSDPHFGFLFGGGRSIVDVFGASRVGADRRPLNGYLGGFGPEERPAVFLDPLDHGTSDSQLTGFAPGGGDLTVFELTGTSYVLNDHALDTVPCPFVEIFDTLIPPRGGRAPMVETPSRTWLAGQSPIYNYDDGGDKGELWGRDRVRATLAFVDGHVKVAVPVPPGPVNSTSDYTFFPRPTWAERFEHVTAEAH